MRSGTVSGLARMPVRDGPRRNTVLFPFRAEVFRIPFQNFACFRTWEEFQVNRALP